MSALKSMNPVVTANPPAPVCSKPFLISNVVPEGNSKVLPEVN